jgi:hypothetical protein
MPVVLDQDGCDNAWDQGEAMIDTDNCAPARKRKPKESKEARAERQAREEWRFVDVLRRAGNHVEAEVTVTPERKWRVDYLIDSTDPNSHGSTIALEIQGIGFGHHSFGAIMKTYEKSNAIAAQGWRLVQVTRAQVANGEALEALARCGVRVEAP